MTNLIEINLQTHSMMCVDHLTGGPLQARLPNNRIYLIGTVSYGDHCARPGFPGVYTKCSSKTQLESS